MKKEALKGKVCSNSPMQVSCYEVAPGGPALPLARLQHLEYTCGLHMRIVSLLLSSPSSLMAKQVKIYVILFRITKKQIKQTRTEISHTKNECYSVSFLPHASF